MVLSLVPLFVCIYIVHINGQNHFQSCQIGSPDKCLGDTMNTLDLGTPYSDAGYINSKNQTNYESCADLCTWHSDCYMASFRIDNGSCQLYRKISFRRSTSPIIKLFIWYCCAYDNYKVENRCSGFWKFKPRSRSDNKMRPLDPLKEIKAINLYECQMMCLNNSICGAINYFRQDVLKKDTVSCQLIIGFPVENLVFLDGSDWSTFQWQCSEQYSLPIPSVDCFPRIGRDEGLWMVQNESIAFDINLKHLIYFHTFDYMQCLDNCALYPQCQVAWYSLKSFFCILQAEKETPCADISPHNDYNFTTYVWRPCDQPFRKSIKTDQVSGRCRTLVDNKHVYIHPIKCGRYPTDISNLHKCWKDPSPNHGTIYSDNLSCQLNQSFRVLDGFYPVSHTFGQLANRSWAMVYTGYRSFWLANITDENFVATTDDRCEAFDAKIKPDSAEPLQIMMRSEWFSLKPKGYEAPFSKTPVNNVIISNTEVPFCNCFSVEACSNVMRRIELALQSVFNSIPYNFVVTGDGIAYEARGWDREAAGVGGQYNRDSLLIALCGQYKIIPGVKSLQAVKKLIQMATEMSKVSKNYTLYLYNDIRDRPYPYDGLRRVIELWPHYRGNINYNCQPLSLVTLVVSFVGITVGFILFITFIHHFLHRIWHDKSCNFVKAFRIETMYGNLFQKSKEVLPQILLQSVHNIDFGEIFISPVTSQVYFVEDFPPICERESDDKVCSCRSAIFSMLDLNLFQCNLVNVSSINNLSDLRRCSRTVVFIFQRNADLGNESLLIIHFRLIKSFYRFISKLHQNRCLCDMVSLTKYVPSSECFDDGMSCKEEGQFFDRMSRRNRMDMETKFSVLIDSNNVFRHYR